jgi:hypothetical protein
MPAAYRKPVRLSLFHTDLRAVVILFGDGGMRDADGDRSCQFGRVYHAVESEVGKARLDNLYDMLDDFNARLGK